MIKSKHLLLVLGVLFIGVLFGYKADVHAKPFFTCIDGTDLTAGTINVGSKVFPAFTCSGAREIPYMYPTRIDGYFNARVRCPAGSTPMSDNSPGNGWVVFCRPLSGAPDGDGYSAASSLAPTSYDINVQANPPTISYPPDQALARTDTPGPTGEPSDSADTTGGSGSGSEDNIPRGTGFTETDCSDIKNNSGDCGMVNIANAAIKFLSVIVGVVVVAMLIAGGVRYASAGPDPQAVTKAKEMIRNAIFAIVTFMILLRFLSWVVPGGML